MAYRVPEFNLWATVYSNTGAFVGWTKCQLRGPINGLFDLEQSDQPPSCRILWEILVPAGTDIRTRNCSGQRGASSWDHIYLCNDTRLAFIVQAVGDKGAGFDNEYRLCYVTPDLDFVIGNDGLPRVNPEVVPPSGFTPVPILNRVT